MVFVARASVLQNAGVKGQTDSRARMVAATCSANSTARSFTQPKPEGEGIALASSTSPVLTTVIRDSIFLVLSSQSETQAAPIGAKPKLLPPIERAIILT